MKSSFDMILQQMSNVDCMFLSETWLKPDDLNVIRQMIQKQNYHCILKTSVDSEVTLEGRPYGGVCFIYKNMPNINIVNIEVDDERICAIKLLSGGRVVLTIIGAYMPHCDGSAARAGMYSETLEKIQLIIDNIDPSPVMFVGDMNAPLPRQHHLPKQWYKRHPFNRHSLLLYDFICNNELYCCNIDFNQKVNYTYSKNGHTSYIDHVFMSKFASGMVNNCQILSDLANNVSDHFPLKSSINIGIENTKVSAIQTNPVNKYPSLNWSKINLCNQYKENIGNLADGLINIPPREIDSRAEATQHVNNMCNNITSAMHNAVKAVNNECNERYKGKYRKKHWWDGNCLLARDRQRFWHRLWVSCDRPREGHIYDSYKLAKNTYRNTCRFAINACKHNMLNNLNTFYGDRRIKQFWNLIRKNKQTQNNGDNSISINSLISHFRKKFDQSESENNPFIANALTEVNEKYSSIENHVYMSFNLTERNLIYYIKNLRAGCAAGIDGITAEHLKWSVGTKIIKILCNLIIVCIRFGIVPDSSAKGLLIPLLKKPNCDTTLPKNYRPIIISTTFSKLLEMIILKDCEGHIFHDLQFGFIPDRGTTMAAALTHDVINYMTRRGSPVYVCSLDAEGAFDSIPHAILLKKSLGIIADKFWRLMVYWYRKLTVQVKWENVLSEDIPIRKGTRQGGLSSPFLFNLFYQDMIDHLSNMQVGVSINNINYNVLCYADDILLCSATITGLQSLINFANEYITKHGLRFNPDKTLCMTFGKSNFNNRKWFLEDSCLREVDNLMYLGVCLSSDGSAHIKSRINAARRAFFALKSTGAFSNGSNAESISYIFNTAIRPVLLYGNQCIAKNKKSIEEIEKMQSKLLKSALNLKPFCKSTPLLDAMKVPRIELTIKQQEITLLKACLLSSSRTSKFYNYMLRLHLNDPKEDKCNLVGRVMRTCDDLDLSFVNTICERNYIKNNVKQSFSTNDGLIDTIVTLTYNLNKENRDMINALLMPY